MYLKFKTERLFIRPITIADRNFILRLLNSEGWLKNIGDRKVFNEVDAEDYIQKILNNKNVCYNVFELRKTDQPIGIITFLNRDNFKFPDIGFAILPAYEKNGYTYEATKRYLDEIINKKKESKIVAISLPDNIGSIKLITKLGLKYEDTIVEQSKVVHLYSLTLNKNNSLDE